MFEQRVLDEIQTLSQSGIRIGGNEVIYIDPISVDSAPHDADLLLFTHLHIDYFLPKTAKNCSRTIQSLPHPKAWDSSFKDSVHIVPDVEHCRIMKKRIFVLYLTFRTECAILYYKAMRKTSVSFCTHSESRWLVRIGSVVRNISLLS